jgi:hypothetical protein
MKPLNRDEPGCNYTTSNCVIWQGPDIPCIKLCKGDTVSDVVFKLATELCDVLNILEIEPSATAIGYDLSCLNIQGLPPQDFQQLIQFIINKLCALSGNPVPPAAPGNGCPDCMMDIAPAFYYQNPVGDTVTQMQLTDYATAMGNTINNILIQINQQQQAINSLETRVETLENTPPAIYIPPTVTPSCVLPAVPTEMDQVLTALEQQFCELRNATGDSSSIYQNIAKQCAGLNVETQLSNPNATMASIVGWSSVVANMAQAMGNLWLAICDIRTAVRNTQLCCPTGCDGVSLQLFANLVGDILTVYPSGVVAPAGFLQCSGQTQIKITDSNNASIIVSFDFLAYLNNPTGYAFSLNSTPINTSLDLTVVIEPCLQNNSTNATCESYLSYYIVNNANCPVLNFTTSTNTIFYDFTSQAGNWTYNIQLWDATGTTMLSNQIQSTTTVQTVNGQFSALSPNTSYKIRLTVAATACPTCEPQACQFNYVTTNPLPCPAPSSASAIIT